MEWRGDGDDAMRLLMDELDQADNMSVSREGEGCRITVKSDSGTGSMLFYEVMPGVILTYNDFHMAECYSGFSRSSDYLSVNHCREGRLEQLMPGGTYSYTSAGDLKLDDISHHAGNYVFPVEHYHGISIGFDVAACSDGVREALGDQAPDVSELRRRFCRGGSPYVLHDFTEAEEVFAGLYHVRPAIRRPFARLRALELLLLLSQLEYDESCHAVEYFTRAQVQKVKEARRIMVADLMSIHTVGELAACVGMPTTAFKACFKGVFGLPPYAYLRSYRMERAAALLRSGKLSVAAIGAQVGYDSPSKFTAAFKAVMGLTPTSYRRGQ
ncbi:helix-turn-helix domain-containing protein [Olsenella phocaeensis]|uniref:helix-turn-helix domain-containing protein n=1 Tax=Olsenella phocaeensis TaxID=1852385 RepID=UPI0009FB2E21|nr:AraC family transcriptional regulator [Olsenella phocaeensis]